MKSSTKKNRTRLIVIVTGLIVVILVIVSGYLVYKQKHQVKPPESQQLPSQASNSTSETANTQPATSADVTTPSVNTTPPPIPAKPTFTKSSGNNGPIPGGVNVNFICTAELNVDCVIVLVSGGKQITVGPTKVTDNGRGQYFASFYWTSVKGSYKITAQAKNSQGGVSSSITQALEVQ